MKLTTVPITLLLCALLLQVSYSIKLKKTFKSKTRAEDGCYLNHQYGRGAGTPLNGCPAGYERNGALCYPLCRPGYSGNGPMCIQTCPPGFGDTIGDCTKPRAYGRGVGKISHCNNCEKYGGLWYPICAPNFHNFGCCLCTPNCPPGWPDVGAACQKSNYGRGAGIPMGCAPNQVKSGALCYPQCRPGFNGVGPVCWPQCPPQYPTTCGALCLSADQSCGEVVADQVLTGFEAVVDTVAEIEDPAAAIAEAIKGAAELGEKLGYPGCG